MALHTEHPGGLKAQSVQSGSPILLTVGNCAIEIEADVLLSIVNEHWPEEDR
jgi:hypothetical protein